MISLDEFLSLAIEHEWTVYNDGRVNIVGVRNKRGRVNHFDDVICLFKKSPFGRWTKKYYPATTRPGTPYLLAPLNPKGTAILVPGQYRSYSLGLHKSKYQALIQTGPVKVYRDGNKDDICDENKLTIEEGYFGINIHKAGILDKLVGTNSAGCQVIKNQEHFAEFVGFCKTSASLFGNHFTYTLVEL